jgi:CheY-like chemotaxis protein
VANNGKPLILLAEDNRVIADVLRFNLERAGYGVVVARNGREALELFRRQNFELVITDYQMPGLNGEQLCRGIRQGEHRPQVEIFLCSAKSFEIDTARLCEELQIRQLFEKPFSPRAVVASARDVISPPTAAS